MPQGHATSREKAERIISEYKSSGLTRQQFCSTKNIKVGTFHWWMKRYNDVQKVKPSNFAQVAPQAKPISAESDLTIDLPSGARLKWRGTVVLPPLSALLETLCRGTVPVPFLFIDERPGAATTVWV